MEKAVYNGVWKAIFATFCVMQVIEYFKGAAEGLGISYWWLFPLVILFSVGVIWIFSPKKTTNAERED